jgi:2,3-bisphosphoglycerate-independent phosphoglycerate mutase
MCVFANADVVAHTGIFDAVLKAVETVDMCVHDIAEEVLKRGGVCIVSADHGNAEQMIGEDGRVMRGHTGNPVPLTVIGAGNVTLRNDGNVCDIAPTMLHFLGIETPKEMTGASLVV